MSLADYFALALVAVWAIQIAVFLVSYVAFKRDDAARGRNARASRSYGIVADREK